MQARNETVRASRRLGRTIWKRWSGYHLRSRAETKMHCFKLLGERVMAREFNRATLLRKVEGGLNFRVTPKGLN